MKAVLFLAVSALTVIGLMILQLRSMRKYHPNAELLIGLLKRLDSDSFKKKIPDTTPNEEYPL